LIDYGLGQFIPRVILWPRPIHTLSGQIIGYVRVIVLLTRPLAGS